MRTILQRHEQAVAEREQLVRQMSLELGIRGYDMSGMSQEEIDSFTAQLRDMVTRAEKEYDDLKVCARPFDKHGQGGLRADLSTLTFRSNCARRRMKQRTSSPTLKPKLARSGLSRKHKQMRSDALPSPAKQSKTRPMQRRSPKSNSRATSKLRSKLKPSFPRRGQD